MYRLTILWFIVATAASTTTYIVGRMHGARGQRRLGAGQ